MDMIAQILSGLAVVLSSIIVYRHVKAFNFWRSRGINGPTPWPFLGTNIYYFFNIKVDVDQRWREKYGRVYGIYEGLTPVLRVSDANLTREIFIKQFASITDRNHQFVYQDNTSRWLFFSKGKHWSNQRVLISPIFSTGKLKKIFNTVSTCTGKFIDEVESRLNAKTSVSNGNGASKAKVQLSKDEMMSLTLDVISRAFFGLRLDTYKDKTSSFYKQAFAFARFDVPWFLLWMLIPSFISKYFKLDLVRPSQYEFFDKLSQKTIAERRKATYSKGQYDFIQAMLEAELPTGKERVFTEEDDRESHFNDRISHQQMERELQDQSEQVQMRKFTDLEIRAQMTFFFIAGFETTSSTIGFCLYVLGHEPQIQEKLYEELKTIGKLDESTGNDPEVDYSELMSLRELDAFFSETVRIYNPVTESQRMVTAEAGVTLPCEPPLHLPKGTVLSMPGLVIHRDPEYWPEPLKFDMSRFYPENKDRIVSGSYSPFGIGPRNCAGMRFAIMTVKLTLAKILLKYRVSPGPLSRKFPPSYKQHGFFLQLEHDDFVLSPRETSS